MVSAALDVIREQIGPWKEGEVRENIFVMPSKICELFVEKVTKNIEKIEENPVGKRLLEKISHLPTSIIIRNLFTDSNNRKDDIASIVLGEGEHVVSLVEHIPLDSTCLSSSMEEIPFPSDVILFHELVHAYPSVTLKGKVKSIYCSHCDPVVWSRDDEYRTIIGFPLENFEKGLPPITENEYRKAANLPERFSHHSMETLNPFFSERIRLLGSIHQRNIALNKESSGPPPVALCSEDDLAPDGGYLLIAELKGLDGGLNPSDDPNPTTLYRVINPGLLENKSTYIFSVGDESEQLETVKKLLIGLIPRLVDMEFELLSGSLLKISEEERKMVIKNYNFIKI